MLDDDSDDTAFRGIALAVALSVIFWAVALGFVLFPHRESFLMASIEDLQSRIRIAQECKTFVVLHHEEASALAAIVVALEGFTTETPTWNHERLTKELARYREAQSK